MAACESVPDPTAWGAALEKLDEVKRIACPEPAAADRKTLERLTARPQHWPEKGATKGDLQRHIDRLELSERAKAAAGARVLAELERCRGGVEPTS